MKMHECLLTQLRKNPLARAAVDGARGAASRWHARRVMTPAPAYVPPPQRKPRVLLLGVYLAYQPHTASHLAERFASSRSFAVDQAWAAIRGEANSTWLARVTHHYAREQGHKFALLNRLLAAHDWRSYDYVVLSDDDITLPIGFLDAFLSYQAKHDLALAQPARTPWSRSSYGFVKQRLRTEARITRFVEAGPITSIRRDLAPLLMPFDEESPMGWGFDLIWPLIVEGAGLRMGIVDATPVDHTLRGQAAAYSGSAEFARMQSYLTKHRHLPLAEALVVRERYGSRSWL
jgi:hypothetical protein